MLLTPVDPNIYVKASSPQMLSRKLLDVERVLGKFRRKAHANVAISMVYAPYFHRYLRGADGPFSKSKPGHAAHNTRTHAESIQPTPLKAFSTPDVFQHALVFNFPECRTLFDVFQLVLDLGVELVVKLCVLAQRISHLATQGNVIGEYFIDTLRVHQHLNQLIQDIVNGFVTDLDAALLRH